MVNAAQPHKRYPKMTFLDIFAVYTQRQAHSLTYSENIENEIWNEALDHPF